MPEAYMSTREAAEALGVSLKTIQARILSGAMRAERIGARVWLVPVAEVERWRAIGKLKPGRKPANG
jgi:excisionase family DNA binding protein